MAPRRRRRRMMALLPLLAAAGCATSAEREEEALREAVISGRASLAAIGGPVAFQPSSDAAPRPGDAAGPRRAPVAAARPAVLGPVPTTTAELVGLPAELLRQRLGEPAFRRREGTAEIWLYAGTACAVDVILYRDRPGAPAPAPRVAHAAARAAGTEPRTEAACLAEIAAGQGSGLGSRRPGPEAEPAQG